MDTNCVTRVGIAGARAAGPCACTRTGRVGKRGVAATAALGLRRGMGLALSRLQIVWLFWRPAPATPPLAFARGAGPGASPFRVPRPPGLPLPPRSPTLRSHDPCSLPCCPSPSPPAPCPGDSASPAGMLVVLAPDPGETALASARVLRDAVEERCGVRLSIEAHRHRDGLGPHLALSRSADVGDGYRLEVGAQGARDPGRRSRGPSLRRRALIQLVDSRGGVPACRIQDAPALTLRGIMLDVSRGKVPTVAAVQELVDLCVRLKLNVLMLYTEHTFAFRRHPEIGAGSSPFTAEEMLELDAYAAARHVELIPTLQSLGHMERVLSLPRYAGLAETDLGWTLAPGEPGTRELLEDLYAEYLPNFRSRFFNANCDEPWDLGRGRSRKRADAIGRGGVFLEHVHQVRDLARAHGKRTMIWADVVHQHPELAPQLDRDIVLLDWWYEAEGDVDRVRVFRELGLEFLVCPGTSSWNCLVSAGGEQPDEHRPLGGGRSAPRSAGARLHRLGRPRALQPAGELAPGLRMGRPAGLVRTRRGAALRSRLRTRALPRPQRRHGAVVPRAGRGPRRGLPGLQRLAPPVPVLRRLPARLLPPGRQAGAAATQPDAPGPGAGSAADPPLRLRRGEPGLRRAGVRCRRLAPGLRQGPGRRRLAGLARRTA